MLHDDLARRVLRSLVPAALALGFLAVYPAIAPRVVARLGPGFSPPFVALYVVTLVGLFGLDAWARDRRMARLKATVEEAERRAEMQRERADELRFVLDVAHDLDGESRLESALFTVLDRLGELFPFETGYVYLRDAAGRVTRRGIRPLTARPSDRVRAFVESALQVSDGDAPEDTTIDDVEAGRVACPIHSRGNVIGLLVLEGVDRPGEHDRARLLAVADRLGTALNGLRLLEEVGAKERALRRAYRELRATGDRLARSSALEETGALGLAASDALHSPTEAALAEVRRLEREAAAGGRDGALASLRRLKSTLGELRSLGDQLRGVGRRVGRPAPCAVNDHVVTALDHALPDLKRSGIEVRLRLDEAVRDVLMDEGVLMHVLSRSFRSARASLRRAPSPRRLTVETRARGEGVTVSFRDNGAGIDPPGSARRVRRGEDEGATSLERAVRRATRELGQADLSVHGVSVGEESRLGEGRTLTVHLRGAQRISTGGPL
ncbi:MAG: GAF domain-containing protein [Planctomycetota bacterium JB042]